MAKKEMWQKILEIEEVQSNEELKAFVEKEIETIDKRLEKARERKSAKDDELMTEIYKALNTEDFTTIDAIVAAIGKEDVTPAKVTSRLSRLVKEGKVEKETVSSGDEVKRKVKGYRIVE